MQRHQTGLCQCSIWSSRVSWRSPSAKMVDSTIPNSDPGLLLFFPPLLPYQSHLYPRGLTAHLASSMLSFFAGLQEASPGLPLLWVPVALPVMLLSVPILLAPCLARDDETAASSGCVLGIQNCARGSCGLPSCLHCQHWPAHSHLLTASPSLLTPLRLLSKPTIFSSP